MGSHLDKAGRFQSDKYPEAPPDSVPLKVTDKSAQDLLWDYALRRESVDAEFTADLKARLKAVGYVPPPTPIVPKVAHDDLAILHEIEDDLYRASLWAPEFNEAGEIASHYGKETAPPIEFHRGSPVDGWRGWTTAHVLRALIAHVGYHQTTPFACEDNEGILGALRLALSFTKRRATDRKARGVLYDTKKP